VTDLQVTVVNATAVAAMWADVTGSLEHIGDPLTVAVAAVIVPAAAARAPRATGRLAGSHIATREGATAATVTNTAPYARFVHYGTRYQTGRPWLAEVLTANATRLTDALTDALQTDVDRAAART
jgi:HK97 gp10 family phage protein